MLRVKETKEGSVFEIRLQPRAAHNRISGVRGGVLCLRVTAPPVEGEANRAVLELLAEALGYPKTRLEIVTGQKGRNKSVLIRGVPADDAARRLEHVLNRDS